MTCAAFAFGRAEGALAGNAAFLPAAFDFAGAFCPVLLIVAITAAWPGSCPSSCSSSGACACLPERAFAIFSSGSWACFVGLALAIFSPGSCFVGRAAAIFSSGSCSASEISVIAFFFSFAKGCETCCSFGKIALALYLSGERSCTMRAMRCIRSSDSSSCTFSPACAPCSSPAKMGFIIIGAFRKSLLGSESGKDAAFLACRESSFPGAVAIPVVLRARTSGSWTILAVSCFMASFWAYCPFSGFSAISSSICWNCPDSCGSCPFSSLCASGAV